MKRIIVWFRNNLRLHDNEVLHEACQKADEVLLVYCFQPSHFGIVNTYGFQKTGTFRTQFLIETVQDLQQNIEQKSGKLLVFQEEPENILPQLAQQYGACAVYALKEYGTEEESTEIKVENQLLKKNIGLKLFESSTLFAPNELPFPIRLLPDIFTEFRKKVEKECTVRKLFPTPERFKVPHNLPETVIPTAEDLGVKNTLTDSRSALHFKGGETAALERLNDYFWKKDLLKNYKETRNGLIGADYSSKFSAWLANGSLSSQFIYHEIKKYEQERCSNASTYWLFFELLWRDYFKFIAKKYGKAIFLLKGIQAKYTPSTYFDKTKLLQWINGKTGVDFVDANMCELALTGFMSNRGRQNVASFLVNDLKIDWRYGAAYFQQQLIDYDVCSNYGNWNYIAGVGTDPRSDRYFNIQKQASMYDPKGEYVRLWLEKEQV
jgi:deoxyribodipyrimidine photo-lyase